MQLEIKRAVYDRARESQRQSAGYVALVRRKKVVDKT